MLNRNFVKNILLCFFFAALFACSSTKAKLSPQFDSEKIKVLALLPTDYPSVVQREKVDAIVKAVRSELVNKNFVVLADSLVNKICSLPTCPERQSLTDKYQVEGFVSISVSSVSRTNFLAGFYNAVKGKLTITDVNSGPLVEISHTQSERGGLLFNSGQIVQGIISYAENSEKKSFSKLSTTFAKSLISKVPASKNLEVNNDAVAVNISKVKVKQIEPEVYQVCAEATPDSLVSVVINKQSTNLRPVSEGNYCGIFLHNQSFIDEKSAMYVAARSPFGNSVRKEISLSEESDTCNLENHVLLSNKNGKPAIQIACVDISNGKSPVIGECTDKINKCMDNKFIVFKVPSNLGPYKKVAEIRSTSWIDNSAKKGAYAHYELVSVSKAGVWSAPVAAKSAINEG